MRLVGDLNLDGKLDVVLLKRDTAEACSILLGRGDGNFQPERNIPGVPSSSAATLADLNQDGKLDLATTYFGDYDESKDIFTNCVVSVFPGKGDGTFGPPAVYPVG